MKIRLSVLFLFLLVTIFKAQSQIVDTIINLTSYNLHFKIIKGSGSFILFESGGGLDATQWDSVTTSLHHAINATLISYDRQGFGKSSMDTSGYNIQSEINGLEYGLRLLGYARVPCIIVSHSLGAFYARLYASKHPKQVKGMVMLDPRIPSFEDMLFARKTIRAIDRNTVRPENMSLYYVLYKMEKNSVFTRHTPIPSNIPILDIMAEKGPFDAVVDNKRFKDDQKRFVKMATNRKLFFAKGSAHNIPQDKPTLVIDQVIKFYTKHSH